MPSLEAVRARAGLNHTIRSFFQARDFLEVETPALVSAAGTDPHLDPVRATLHVGSLARPMALHTSPEFAMKELLVEGLDRIYQLCHVWRDGEVGEQHNPEFTILEWYRADAGYGAIVGDVEALVRQVLPERLEIAVAGYQRTVSLGGPFERVTMQRAWVEAVGIDPLESAGDADGLLAAVRGTDLPLYTSDWPHWDELFFWVMLEAVEPWLAERGAVFLTEWPVQLAVLARRCAHDARVAERFELYVGGIELANGFGELTDPVEQRTRFEADNAVRRDRGKVEEPLPERFLAALERGMPDAAGVALGMDRLLMLAVGASEIGQVLPFAVRR